MIVEWLLDILEVTFVGVGGMFPTSTLLEGRASSGLGSWSLLLNLLSDINYFVPIGPVFSLVLAALTLFPLLTGCSLGLWVLMALRGGSARG